MSLIDGVDRLPPVDSHVAVQNLLQYFRIGNQAFSFGDQAF